MSVKFNMNDEVWVKITPTGRALLRKYYAEIGMQVPDRKTDPGGRMRLQLWEVAKIFGPGMYLGGEPPIEMEIEFA